MSDVTTIQPEATLEQHEAGATRRTGHPVDPRAWLVWVASALVVGLTLFNPWYQLILIGIVVLLWPGDSDAGPLLRLRVLIRIGVLALIIGGGFNMLVVRVGEVVLFRLPDAIPILGGPYTAESLLYGVLNALRFVGILFAFALFNRSVEYADVLRLAPSALFELGLIISIGFTLAPSMLRAFNEIREVQALRGHRGRGLRDLLPLFAPLVASEAERALTLAESMEARGFGVSGQRRGLLALAGVIGLLAVAFVNAFTPLPPPLLWLLIALLAASVALTLRDPGRTRLRRGHWGGAETLVSLGALLPVAVYLFADRAALVYEVYQMSAVGLPPFNPWIAVAMLGLAVPLVFSL